MNDPYQVLGVPETATDAEVRKAYLNLARKYHPDNYHDSPLADLAQEKMKEINAAYEQITKERSGRSSAIPVGRHPPPLPAAVPAMGHPMADPATAPLTAVTAEQATGDMGSSTAAPPPAVLFWIRCASPLPPAT